MLRNATGFPHEQLVVEWQKAAVALAFGVLTVALTWPPRGEVITRKRGILLMALYAAYLVLILRR